MLLQKVDNRMQYTKSKHANADLYTPELSFLTDDEIQALHSKLQSIRGDLFTKEVMNTLLVDDDRQQQEELSFFSPQSKNESTKIRLSATQLAMCNKMGITPTGYANIIKGAKK
jgi:AAA+ superfamily predicted ATPase